MQKRRLEDFGFPTKDSVSSYLSPVLLLLSALVNFVLWKLLDLITSSLVFGLIILIYCVWGWKNAVNEHADEAPGRLSILGMLWAGPFLFLMGGIKSWRHRKATKKWEEWFRKTEARHWQNLSGLEFEKELADLFQRAGHKAEVTKATGDGGVDIFLEVDGQKQIVECKAHQKPIGPKTVRELNGVMEDFEAELGIVASVSGFTKGAQEFAEGKPIKLMDLDEIIGMQIDSAESHDPIDDQAHVLLLGFAAFLLLGTFGICRQLVGGTPAADTAKPAVSTQRAPTTRERSSQTPMVKRTPRSTTAATATRPPSPIPPSESAPPTEASTPTHVPVTKPPPVASPVPPTAVPAPTEDRGPYFTDGWDKYNCGDFSTWAEANAAFQANQPGDPNRLDNDDDGIPCEGAAGAP